MAAATAPVKRMASGASVSASQSDAIDMMRDAPKRKKQRLDREGKEVEEETDCVRGVRLSRDKSAKLVTITDRGLTAIGHKVRCSLAADRIMR